MVKRAKNTGLAVNGAEIFKMYQVFVDQRYHKNV